MGRKLRQIRKEAEAAYKANNYELGNRLGREVDALREESAERHVTLRTYLLGLIGVIFIFAGFIGALVSAAYNFNIGLAIGIFVFLNGVVFYIAGENARRKQ